MIKSSILLQPLPLPLLSCVLIYHHGFFLLTCFWCTSSSSLSPHLHQWGAPVLRAQGPRCMAAGQLHQPHLAWLMWYDAFKFAFLKSFPGDTNGQPDLEPLVIHNVHFENQVLQPDKTSPVSSVFFLCSGQSPLFQAVLTSLHFPPHPVHTIFPPFCVYVCALLSPLIYVLILYVLAYCFPKCVPENASLERVCSGAKKHPKQIYFAFYLLLWEICYIHLQF